MAAGVKVIVITDGPNNVVLKGIGIDQTVTPPSVTAVDTTAGGDAFIGGLLAELSSYGISESWHQDSAFLTRAVDIACRCGAHAVTRPGAYAALPTHARHRSPAQLGRLALSVVEAATRRRFGCPLLPPPPAH